jgi:hypothetical protein
MNLKFCVNITQAGEKITQNFGPLIHNRLNYSFLTLWHRACLFNVEPKMNSYVEKLCDNSGS